MVRNLEDVRWSELTRNDAETKKQNTDTWRIKLVVALRIFVVNHTCGEGSSTAQLLLIFGFNIFMFKSEEKKIGGDGEEINPK